MYREKDKRRTEEDLRSARDAETMRGRAVTQCLRAPRLRLQIWRMNHHRVGEGGESGKSRGEAQVHGAVE